MSITVFEAATLRAIAINDFADGIPGSEVWANTVGDRMPADGPKGAQIRGVISSLAKKGLVICRGSGPHTTLRMTDAGISAYRASAQRHYLMATDWS